jgi:hypothetical protein
MVLDVDQKTGRPKQTPYHNPRPRRHVRQGASDSAATAVTTIGRHTKYADHFDVRRIKGCPTMRDAAEFSAMGLVGPDRRILRDALVHEDWRNRL